MILFHFKISLFLIILAFLHSKLELEIEGTEEDGGWAKWLPCWRRSNWFTQLVLGKEMTGYHFQMILLGLLLLHSPFMFITWTIKLESLFFGYFCIYWVMEDFVYFLLHPKYRLKNFRKGKISWHKRFWGFLPVSYWSGIILGIIFLILGK